MEEIPLKCEKLLTVRVTKHWHRLPREAVEFPSQEILKTQQDTGLNNLLAMLGAVGLD